jgi:hypothetical protein
MSTKTTTNRTSLNSAQALPGPNLFLESTMKRPSTLDQELADLKISELPSIQRVQAKQERMLRLLKRSQADPVSYAGLEYCTAEFCGRVNCSEACWFGTLRRRVRQVQAIRLLMEEFDPPLHKIIAWKTDWGCPYSWLHYIKPRIAKALMTRVFNSMCSISVTAVGTVKVVPFGTLENRYFVEIHMIVGGANREELESAFRPVQPDASVRISKVEDVNRVIDEVTTCNSPRLWQPLDDPPEPAQLAEFYAWLAEMKVATRIFRYGCDEYFELITYRQIRFNPRPKKERRPGRRRYYGKRRKRKPYRPWDVLSPQDRASYYED